MILDICHDFLSQIYFFGMVGIIFFWISLDYEFIPSFYHISIRGWKITVLKLCNAKVSESIVYLVLEFRIFKNHKFDTVSFYKIPLDQYGRSLMLFYVSCVICATIVTGLRINLSDDFFGIKKR